MKKYIQKDTKNIKSPKMNRLKTLEENNDYTVGPLSQKNAIKPKLL